MRRSTSSLQVEAAGEPDIAQRQIRVGLQHAVDDPGLSVLDRNAQPLLAGSAVHAMGLDRELQVRPGRKGLLPRDDMKVIGVFERRALGPRAIVVHTQPAARSPASKAVFSALASRRNWSMDLVMSVPSWIARPVR
jgi:hypothetical protein